MNAHTGDVAKPYTPGYIVSREPDRTGKLVPTEHEHDMTAPLDKVIGHRRRIAAGSDDSHAAVGYWRDPEVAKSPYEVDSSAIFHDRRTAVAKANERGEKSVWDLGRMKDIRLRKNVRKTA